MIMVHLLQKKLKLEFLAFKTIAPCLNDSKVSINDVDLINTHGTSTPLGDVAELKAIDFIFGDHAPNININSTKSMTGHLRIIVVAK